MPFRLNEFRAKVQFLTCAEMPSLIYKAAQKTNVQSNTVYLQRAVAAALARDLDLDYDELIAKMPPSRTTNGSFNDHRHVGPANTIESVR